MFNHNWSLITISFFVFFSPILFGCSDTIINETTITYSDSTRIIVPDEAPTIQKALELVNEQRRTIYVRSGIYEITERIHITQSNVWIEGEPGAILTLADGTDEPVFLIGTDAENPTKVIENIHITNFEVDGNRYGQTTETQKEQSWIRLNGIDVRMVDGLWISNVKIHNCRSGGLVISWKSQNVFIENSIFYENFFDGIALYDSENISISNFTANSNGAAGLSLDNDLKDVIFNDGFIENNGDVGIFARHANTLNFNNLLVKGNGSHGAFLAHTTPNSNTGVNRLIFNNCCFKDNEGCGFWLASPSSESKDNCLIGCSFSNNKQHPICKDSNVDLCTEGVVIL